MVLPMSTAQNSLPSQPKDWHPLPNLVQTLPPPLDDTRHVVFTRQLWQRTMPNESSDEHLVSNESHAANTRASQTNASGSSRRTSSTISLRSHRRSPSPSRGSKTPLTPEESPPFRVTRKRSAGLVEREDKASTNTSPAHTRDNSGDSAIHVCICQPDPKIPRPRNAFILYRQHHQANVVAQHPGLANPEISKIIGEQWQNSPLEEKNRWKALAEEEKLRHQQQYPSYRYQPKRNGRRNSLSSDTPGSAGEKPKCQKCGGRTILTPSVPYVAGQSSSVSPTPGTAITPVTRTLPVLRNLSLQSPAAQRSAGAHPMSKISPAHHVSLNSDDRDDLGPLSPDSKRRRHNGDHPSTVNRTMPPRYGNAPPGAAVGPGTPFPFGGPAPAPHPYPPGAVHTRRDSLPGIRGVVSPPGSMAPPPRPGMGYAQHRLSQGHVPHDRSLTLPPLQTSHQGAVATATAAKTADGQIMDMSFRYKIKVLSQVAPPAPKRKDASRGPLIAVEGDNAEAVRDLSAWLRETLDKGDDLIVNLLDGPQVEVNGRKEEIMAQYHKLAAEWLGKSKDILESILAKQDTEKKENGDAAMTDAGTMLVTCSAASNARTVDENYDDSEDSSSSQSKKQQADQDQGKMDIDKESSKRNSSTTSSGSTFHQKPVTIIPNYSLHTSNFFARMIPIGASDPYLPHDHWQWNATLWRGIIGPDLTIYVREAASVADTGPSVQMEAIEGRPDITLFTVKRRKLESPDGSDGVDHGMEIEASVLRRVGFEVSEWVRAFEGKAV